LIDLKDPTSSGKHDTSPPSMPQDLILFVTFSPASTFRHPLNKEVLLTAAVIKIPIQCTSTFKHFWKCFNFPMTTSTTVAFNRGCAVTKPPVVITFNM
jgi:hypothetical protein